MYKYLVILLSLLLLLTGCGKSTTFNGDPTPTADQSIEKDVTPPWFTGINYNIETTVGNAVDLTGPSAWDDVDGARDVEIQGNVDWNKEGVYYITYVARDTSGNVQSAAITVTVLAATPTATATPATIASTPVPTPTAVVGCDVEEAKDPNKPCAMVLSEDTEQFVQIWEGYNQDACEAAGYEMSENCKSHGSCWDDNLGTFVGYSCENITTNDWTYWGVGLKYNWEK